MVIFNFHHSFYICQLEFYYEEGISHLLLLFRYLIIYISIDYPMDYNLLLSLFFLLLKLSQIWLLETSCWLLCPFDMLSNILSIPLHSGTTICPRFIWCFPCPSPRINISSRSPDYIFWGFVVVVVVV